MVLGVVLGLKLASLAKVWRPGGIAKSLLQKINLLTVFVWVTFFEFSFLKNVHNSTPVCPFEIIPQLFCAVFREDSF